MYIGRKLKMLQKLDSGKWDKELMVQMNCLEINIGIATSNVYLNLWKHYFILEPIPHVFHLFTAVKWIQYTENEPWLRQCLPLEWYITKSFSKWLIPKIKLNGSQTSLNQMYLCKFWRKLIWGHLELTDIYSIDKKPMMILYVINYF